MKKLTPLFFAFTLFACNNADNDSMKTDSSADSATATATEAPVSYPYTADYSSSFADGKNAYAANILAIEKAWEDGDLNKAKDMFADSVTMVFSNGYILHGSRDSVMAMGQRERNALASSTNKIHAWTTQRSTDKNENWVNVWFMEKDTDKKGKVDSTQFLETWRLNDEGKADLVYQYAQKTTPPKQ